MVTRDDLQASLDKFKSDLDAFAKKSVHEEYDERIHDAKDLQGNVYKNANPRKTLVQGEEAKVGHIKAALQNYIEPLIEELEGEDVGVPVNA